MFTFINKQGQLSNDFNHCKTTGVVYNTITVTTVNS